MTTEEAEVIKAAIERFYGCGAIVRNFGPDPNHLQLHVESDRDIGLEKYDCAGLILARINREKIDLIATKRGARVFGGAKFAYRQGVIL